MTLRRSQPGKTGHELHMPGACVTMGLPATLQPVQCSELRYISQDAFLHLEHGDRELAEIAYKHCETVRQVLPLVTLQTCHPLHG